MLNLNLEDLVENYEDTISRIEARLNDNLNQRERVIRQQKINSDETLSGVQNLIEYLKLVAVNADNLMAIKDDLTNKAEAKKLAFERMKDSELDLNSKMAASTSTLDKLKEDIRILKLANENLQQQINSSESTNPLTLRLFKSKCS